MDELITIKPNAYLSVISGLNFIEPCPIDRLELLLNSKLLDEWNKRVLPKYKALYKSDKRGMVVHYCRPETQPEFVGRVNPKNNVGAHFIERKARHFLFNNVYADIDMENCQVAILHQLLNHLKTEKGEDIKFNMIETYCLNRDAFLKRIMDIYEIPKRDAKNLIITIMNGGTYNNWRYKNNRTSTIINEVELLEKEFKQTFDLIEKYNPDFIQHLKKFNKFGKSSVVAFYLQTIEDFVLSQCFNYLKDNNTIPVIKDGRGKPYYVCSPSNDGIMIPIEKYYDGILSELNELIKDRFGLDIIFKNKPFDEGYTLEEVKENQKVKSDIALQLEDLIDWKASDQEYYANLFYAHHKEDYIFKSKKTGWFFYNKFNILVNTPEPPIGLNNKITEFCQSHIRSLFDELDTTYEKFGVIAKGIQKISQKLGGTQFIKGIIEKLEAKYHQDDILNKIDSNNMLLCFKNKVFDFSLWEYRDIDKNDYCMSNTGYNAPDFENQFIRKEINDCIDDIFDDKEERDFFMKSVGLSLITNRFERIYIWTGSGANGKGVMSSIISKAFGNYFYQAQTQFITSVPRTGSADSDLYNCRGMKLVMISEPEKADGKEQEVKFNIERIKSITGKDTLTCRALYKDPISYIPQFTMFLQTNEIPNLNKLDGGIKRRIVICPFRNKFVDEPNPEIKIQKKKDETMKDKFSTEAYYSEFMGILLDYIKDIKKDSLPIPNSYKSDTEDYFQSNNPLLDFINNELVKCEGAPEIKLIDIFNAYLDRDYPKINDKTFYNLVKINDLPTKRHKSKGNVLTGYKIKEKQDSTNEPQNIIVELK